MDGFHLHHAMVQSGHIEVGTEATFAVDEPARRATERNHTATHLLHAALKQVLGDHVSQAGSEVTPDRLRFDYTQPEKPTAERMQQVEDLVNEQILHARAAQAVVCKLEEARAAGFVALFGEKYGEQVRTLQVGEFSKELCGGTHVRNTGNIGSFRVVSETAVAAGTRRVEAVTGLGALDLARTERAQLAQIANTLKVPSTKAAERVGELTEELKKTRKDLEKALAPDLDVELQKLRTATVLKNGVHTVLFERPGLQGKDAQELLKRASKAMDPLVAVVFAVVDGEIQVTASVAPSLVARIKAGDLVKNLATVLGGGGGGRPEAAQGKGRDVGKLGAAKAAAEAMLLAQQLR
jgi:alanyl-tRNA synthetase